MIIRLALGTSTPTSITVVATSSCRLRGRVGRGSAASHCVLLYHPPLSQIGRQRLGIMRETNDGFVIAEKDLEL